MTTMTTLLGLLPLVLVPGAGSELYRGLGAVLLGGLLVSTVVTLVLVPVLLGLCYRLFPVMASEPPGVPLRPTGSAPVATAEAPLPQPSA